MFFVWFQNRFAFFISVAVWILVGDILSAKLSAKLSVVLSATLLAVFSAVLSAVYRPLNRLRFHYGIGSGICRVILSDVLSAVLSARCIMINILIRCESDNHNCHGLLRSVDLQHMFNSLQAWIQNVCLTLKSKQL